MTGLDVDADLTLAADGDTFSVDGEGDTVVVDAPSLGAALRLRSVLARLRTVADAVPGSTPNAGLTFAVRVRGVRVARAAADVSPGVVSSLLGVAPARVRVGGVLRAAVRAYR
ncbi:MAG: hypothetical protein ABEJ78_08020 [Haloferacaceae archaeon]